MWVYPLQAVLVQLCLWAVSARTDPKATPNYSIYHSETQLMDSVAKLVESAANMKIELISHTEDNYTAEVPIVTISPPHQVEDEVLRVLVDFGEHAREFISADTGLHFLKLLAEQELLTLQFDAFRSEAGVASDTAALLAFLDCCVVLKVVPMENREGRKKIEKTGDFCYRKNGHGVDPNRNWEVDWGKREKDYSAYEEHAGLHAFSEPEAHVLRDLVHEFKPHVWVNVHSGMDGLFMPYDHVDRIPDHPSSAHTLRILDELNVQACDSKCVVGSGGRSVGYLAHGTATDYMYEKANVSIAMTWEIYGDMQADFNDCFRMFNPLTQAPESYSTAEKRIPGNVMPSSVVSTPGTNPVQVPGEVQGAINSTVNWVAADRKILDQERGVWMRLAGVMFVMAIGLLYFLRAFLGRRKRLAKAAAGRRENR